MSTLHPKVKFGAIAGAVGALAVTLLDVLGASLPPTAAAALTLVATVLGGYAKKS